MAKDPKKKPRKGSAEERHKRARKSAETPQQKVKQSQQAGQRRAKHPGQRRFVVEGDSREGTHALHPFFASGAGHHGLGERGTGQGVGDFGSVQQPRLPTGKGKPVAWRQHDEKGKHKSGPGAENTVKDQVAAEERARIDNEASKAERVGKKNEPKERRKRGLKDWRDDPHSGGYSQGPPERRKGASGDDEFDIARSTGDDVEETPWQFASRRFEPTRQHLREIGVDERHIDREALNRVVSDTHGQFGVTPDPAELANYLLTGPNTRQATQSDYFGEGVHDGREGGKRMGTFADSKGEQMTDDLWKYGRGSVPGASPADTDAGSIHVSPGVRARAEGYDTMRNKMHPRMRDYIEQGMQDSSSPLFSGEGDRSTRLVGNDNLHELMVMLQGGYSLDEGMKYLGGSQQRSERLRRTDTTPSKTKYDDMAKERVKGIKGEKGYGTSKDKFSKDKGPEDFGYGISSPGAQSLEDIRKEHKDWSDSDVFQYREAQKRQIIDHALERDERWVHETKAAMMTNKKAGDREINEGDRVTFFTTNVGAPNASVDANSLIGQYVIKKRKKMLNDNGVGRRDLKGEFPEAVRDRHLIEVSTGISLGVQGQAGLFHNTGWRAGSKHSKGFGKPSPVGAQILRDANGQPVYDKSGNVRYTEGYTKPFSLGTDRDYGLRIFIG